MSGRKASRSWVNIVLYPIELRLFSDDRLVKLRDGDRDSVWLSLDTNLVRS